jgi:HK97 family phage prohead protease
MQQSKEYRYFPGEVRVTSGDTPQIVGEAIVFNSNSEEIMGFTEQIDPHACDSVLAANPDVRGLFNHDSNLILGRTTSGTMKLTLDTHGLQYSIDPPDTQCARDLMVSLKRGDVTGSSFGFIVARDQWTDNPDGSVTRRILELEELLDVSPVVFPAYPATSSGTRNLPASMPAEIRSRIEHRLTDEPNAQGCSCECNNCTAGDCMSCTNPDCVEENCLANQRSLRDYMYTVGIALQV